MSPEGDLKFSGPAANLQKRRSEYQSTPLSGLQRLQRAALSAAVSAGARGVSVASSLISIPITSSYLGQERFGVWMTLASLSAFFAFADMGIGNGLISLVAERAAKRDHDAIRSLVSSASVMLCSAALLVLGIALAAAYFLDFGSLFRVNASVSSEVTAAFLVFSGLMAINIPINLVQKLRVGLQEGYANSLWNIIGNFAGLAALLAAVKFHLGLPHLIFALIGVPALCGAVHLAFFLHARRLWLTPSVGSINVEHIRLLMSLGGQYFLLQVIAAVTGSSDNFLIASVLGAARVSDYAIAAKLFAICAMLAAIVLQPLWPAYSDALARTECRWIRRVFFASVLGVSTCWALFAITSLAYFDEITRHWLNRSVDVPAHLLLGFGFASLVECLTMCFATLLNAAQVLRPQIIIGLISSLAALTLKVNLLAAVGLEALPWSSAVAGLVFSLFPLSIITWRSVLRQR